MKNYLAINRHLIFLNKTFSNALERQNKINKSFLPFSRNDVHIQDRTLKYYNTTNTNTVITTVNHCQWRHVLLDNSKLLPFQK